LANFFEEVIGRALFPAVAMMLGRISCKEAHLQGG
jgi:hypothetical protein